MIDETRLLYLLPQVPASSPLLGGNSTNTSWWSQEITVLGKTKWTMSFNHFVLLFAIFHIVYGAIASVCDLMFFHSLVRRTVRTRYVCTVLPVHRLFLVVIAWIDGVLFVTSSHVTDLVDLWAVLLIFVVMVALTADTALILSSLGAVHGKPTPLFSRPWRNAGVLVVLLLTGLHILVTQVTSRLTWEAGPSLLLTLLSCLLLVASLADTCRGGDACRLDTTLHFFLCISASNMLGLFSVGALLHRLLLRTEFDSF